MVLTQPMEKLDEFHPENTVSIPLWFLRNWRHMNRQAARSPGFHTTMVLTQHHTQPGKGRCQQTFPYHYGSYATKTKKRSGTIQSFCFHTTMVLTQQYVADRIIEANG